jgi:predicted house-cleaning NTP pyrophosphatase (Maf/HAM1 superfamily)
LKERRMLIDGANTMLQIASKLLAKPKQVVKGFNQVQDAVHEEGEDQGSSHQVMSTVCKFSRVDTVRDEYASSPDPRTDLGQ